MSKITDIWFKTNLTLKDLADKLELVDSSYDYENVYEWVIGKFANTELNISRPHLDFIDKPKTTNIIITLEKLPKHEFSREIYQRTVEKLKSIGILPIFLGETTIDDKDKIKILNIVEEIK